VNHHDADAIWVVVDGEADELYQARRYCFDDSGNRRYCGCANRRQAKQRFGSCDCALRETFSISECDNVAIENKDRKRTVFYFLRT
jgi:hypothetical protein